MKQSKKDIELHWRAYCSICWLLSNQDNKICHTYIMWNPKTFKQHKWFYNRELNNTP